MLEKLYDLGARYMTLTHTDSLSWADSGTDAARNNGLTPFGEQVVRKMNELGMMVDLSHVSAEDDERHARCIRGAGDVFALVGLRRVPTPAQRAGRRAQAAEGERRRGDGQFLLRVTSCPSAAKIVAGSDGPRTRAQEEVRRSETRGRRNVDRWEAKHKYPRGTIHDLLDHIDHIAKVAGAEHIGLGSDFDGVSVLPTQLDDVSCYPYITQGLIDRGYTDEQIKGILGGNLLRVMRGVEAYAAKHRDDDGRSRTRASKRPSLEFNEEFKLKRPIALLEREKYDRFRVAPLDPAALRAARCGAIVEAARRRFWWAADGRKVCRVD